MKKAFLMCSLLAGLAFTMTSCKKDDEKAEASLLVVHASPDAPGVDLLVDGSKVNASALNYPGNTGYLTLEAGMRNLKVNVSSSGANVINADVDFTKNMSYSLFAIDSVSKLSTLLLTDDLTTPASGKAHVRFVHLSPNAPAVDVVVMPGASVLFDNTAFKGSKAFTPVDAGTYDLEVRLNDAPFTTVLPLNDIQLEAGGIYTVFAKGFVGGSGTQALGAEIIRNK